MARNGADKKIGAAQQVINDTPEITTILGQTIPGMFATAKVQIGIPKGCAFRGEPFGPDFTVVHQVEEIKFSLI